MKRWSEVLVSCIIIRQICIQCAGTGYTIDTGTNDFTWFQFTDLNRGLHICLFHLPFSFILFDNDLTPIYNV